MVRRGPSVHRRGQVVVVRCRGPMSWSVVVRRGPSWSVVVRRGQVVVAGRQAVMPWQRSFNFAK